MKRKKNNFVYEACENQNVRFPNIEVLNQPYFEHCAEDLIVTSLLRALASRTGSDLTQMRYLEIGANHPISASSTYLLHIGLGMTGVLVEANKALIPDLERIRKNDTVVNVAVAATDSEFVDLYVSNQDEVSSLNKGFVNAWPNAKAGTVEIQNVRACRINRLMEEYFPTEAPAFLSIDVEGLEFEILRDFAFSRWRPNIIQAEASDRFEQGTSKQIADLLTRNGYVIVAVSDVNVIAVDAGLLNRAPVPQERISHTPKWLESSDVDPKIESFEYVSVDIFDTLLFRHCKSPIDAFAFMAHHERVLEVSDYFVDFRVSAEQLAREDADLKGAEDVSLEEIYSCFMQLTNCTYEQAEAIKAIELETEMDVLFPTVFGQNLINYLRGTGKRFVITSDMYLPQAFLEKLLEAKGFGGFERVFVSNEQGRTKHQGTLYQDVISHFGVPAQKILHIGDNRHADGEMAAAAGLETFVVLASKDLPSRSPKPKRHSHLLAGQRPISQIFIANYLETHHFDAGSLDFRELTDDSYFEAFGAVFLAPLITSFVIWMKQQMERKGLDRAVFLARDGKFPKAVFELLWPSCYETSYVAASRRLLTLPFTRLDSDTIHGMFHSTLEGSPTLDAFLAKIAANPELKAAFNRTGWNPEAPLDRKPRRMVMKALMENSEGLYDSFADERETLTNYYRNAFPAGSRSAVFDVGWRGSLQRSLTEITEGSAHITGLYFGTRWQATSILRRNGLDYASFATENGLPKIKQSWGSDFRDLVEFLFSADHGSVLGIVQNETGETLWNMAEVTELERKNLEIAAKIQKGALSGIESVLRTMPVEVLAKYTSPEDECDFRNFLGNPHREDAKRFREIRIFAGVGDTVGESLTRIGDRKTHYYNAKNSRWRAAYGANLNGFTRLWLKHLLRKRKKIIL